VNLVTTAYKRFQQLIHEGAKFCVIGGAGAIITLGGADILHNHMGVGKYTALTITTLVATVVTFIGNRYWTFRHRSGKGTTHESVMFFVLNGVGLLIGYGCLGVVTGLFSLNTAFWYDFANFVGLVLGTLFRFWSYRKWVWHAPAAEPQPGAVYAQPQAVYTGTGPAPQLGLLRNAHQARVPEFAPPQWTSAKSPDEPAPGRAATKPDNGPGHAR
jgi:putative flippase GtrA